MKKVLTVLFNIVLTIITLLLSVIFYVVAFPFVLVMRIFGKIKSIYNEISSRSDDSTPMGAYNAKRYIEASQKHNQKVLEKKLLIDLE
ncbi:MAG: hypothetical protein IJW31_01985 [Lentisphaeria bacterium]|nr:hypothetical protein [Lentisphaeria bacterium]